MGRCEACAKNSEVRQSLLDGFFNAVGYSLVLLLIAAFREVLGMGTFLGWNVPYFSSPLWDKWIIMVMPPGAFFMLAFVVWGMREIQFRMEEKQK
jgi:Na+-transporting NADH:ubiquinone oxidoreductase subunit D